METVRINDIDIPLDSVNSYFSIHDYYCDNVDANIDFVNIDLKKQQKILFLGFFKLDSRINYIPRAALYKLKSSVKGNNAILLLHSIIENQQFDYFFISAAGLDPMGVDFLKELPQAFGNLNKKLFIIDGYTHPINFTFKT